MRIVLSLGDQALGDTLEATDSLVKLLEQDHELVIVHGNGEQVGFHYQKILKSAILSRQMKNDVVALIAQVVIDGHDDVLSLPQTIREIQKHVEDKNVVIANGIPVIADDDGYQAVQMMIDKHRVAAKLALSVEADLLLILAEERRVSIDLGKQELIKMTTDEANTYIREGQFERDSMLPKIEAAILFAEGRKFAQSIIASIEDATDAINGKAGTIVYSI
jgi:carbamate kinase